jgi:hypothetical protein
MDAAIGDDLTEGIEALERADWKAARSALERVLDTTDVPDAYEGLGLALWFLGDVAAGIAARERAFEGYVRAGRCDDTARHTANVDEQIAHARRGMEVARACGSDDLEVFALSLGAPR